jgi:hypothetical protein
MSTALAQLSAIINPPVSEEGIFAESMREHRGTERELDEFYWWDEQEVWE